MVLMAALLATIPFFWFGWADRNDLNGASLALVGAWLLATLSSATFWTLLTRSMLGGFAIGQIALFLVGAVVVNLGVDNASNFVLGLTIDDDRYGRQLDVIRDGIGSSWFKHGDVEYGMDHVH